MARIASAGGCAAIGPTTRKRRKGNQPLFILAVFAGAWAVAKETLSRRSMTANNNRRSAVVGPRKIAKQPCSDFSVFPSITPNLQEMSETRAAQVTGALKHFGPAASLFFAKPQRAQAL